MPTSRRDFLQHAIALSAASALPARALGQTKPTTTRAATTGATTKVSYDLLSPDLFHECVQADNNGDGAAGKTNEEGLLAWRQAYLLQAMIVMYEARHRLKYLDRLIEHFDQMLKTRDRARGVTDYRGLSLPGWQAAAHYTCNAVTLNDAQGRPSLTVRSCFTKPAKCNNATVERGTEPGTFKVIAVRTINGKEPVVDVYDNLTMDPAKTNYAPRRFDDLFTEINAGKGGFRTMFTAREARPSPAAAGDPAPGGPWTLRSQPNLYAVHHGQIIYPIARFCRLILNNDGLRSYHAKAREFAFAAHQAVDLFDEDWGENKDTGEGWYVFPKGSPSEHEGCELPHNQYLALGRAMIELADCAPTGDLRAKYKDRAIKMARTFKNDLTQQNTDTYVWPYFWSKGWGYRGWTAKDKVSEYMPTRCWPRVGKYDAFEDVAHGAIDVGFAANMVRDGLGVFDINDLKRLARTFKLNVMTTDQGRPTTFDFVDGSGAKGTRDIIAATWMPLAIHDIDVYRHAYLMYVDQKPKPGPPALPLALAYFNWINNRLK